MFNSYEGVAANGTGGRAGYVTMIADYLPLQDAYGGPNYFKLEPNALYEIHIDNVGDGKEHITFQFKFNNTLAGKTLPIGPTGSTKDVAIPLTQFGQVTAPNAATLNVGESFTVDIVRGDRRTGVHGQITNVATGNNVFAKPSDNIGTKTIPNYAAYAAQHVYNVNIPGCTGTGKLFVGQRKDPFAVNLGVIFDLVNVPGAADFTPAEAAFLLDPTMKDAGTDSLQTQERDRARDRSADELPARGRLDRHGHRRLDHGQPAPGPAALERAEERLRHVDDRWRRLDPGLAPRHAAGQRSRDRPARQGQVQQLEAA